jgi:hypothetical protein
MNTASSEQIRAETAAILRHARIVQLKRMVLNPAPILDAPLRESPRPKRPLRPVFVFPENARLRRLLMSCVCRRSQ